MDPDHNLSETWTPIPSLPTHHEISTSARVRSFSEGHPYIHEGRKAGDGTILYELDGDTYTVAELMAKTYGEDFEFEIGHEPGERDRELSHFEVNEISNLEGVKPAYEVAEDFRIDSHRVRSVWDGGAY